MTKLEKTLVYKPHLIGHLLGYTKLAKLHSDWIRYIWQSQEPRTLQAHRGSYKTTGVIIIGALVHTIVKPADRILIVRKEFDLNVKPIIRELTRLYRTDEVKQITKEVWGSPVEIVRADSKEIQLKTPYKTAGTQPNITGASIYQSLTGQHYDRILTDDIVTLKDRTSKAEREKIKTQYFELYNIVDPGKPISNIGTPWHKDDAFTVMPEPVKYPIGSTGLDEFTEEHVSNLRARMPSTLFSANYELKHVASDDALFSEIDYIRIQDYSEYKWVGHIDARYSGKDTTAFTFGAEKDGKIILSGFCYDKHVDECMPELKKLLIKFNCGTVYLETNSDKGYLGRDIKKFHPAVKTYHEKMNKHVKIVKFLKDRWVDVQINIDSMPLYIGQLSEYNEGIEPDDCPDSAASIIREAFTKNRTEPTAVVLNMGALGL